MDKNKKFEASIDGKTKLQGGPVPDKKNEKKTNNQKNNLENQENQQKQEKGDATPIEYISLEIIGKAVDKDWYGAFRECLSLLANLNVENSCDITVVTTKNWKDAGTPGTQTGLAVAINDSKWPELEMNDFRKVLNDLFGALNISERYSDCSLHVDKQADFDSLLRPWRTNLKILADTIRKKFENEIKSKNGNLILDHVQLLEIISKTKKYKEESKVIFKNLLEDEFKDYLNKLKNGNILLNSVDDIKNIPIIQAVGSGSGLLWAILSADLDESYKVLDKETFDIFLDIIQQLKSLMEKLLSEAKEKRSEVESKISNYYHDLFAIFDSGLRKTLKEKISWEQWKRFAELGCVGDKNYFFQLEPNTKSSPFLPSQAQSVVEIFGGNKELSKKNVLDWIKDVLSTVVKNKFQVDDNLYELKGFLCNLLKCLVTNYDSEKTTDFSKVFNFKEFYQIIRETKFFEYVILTTLLNGNPENLCGFSKDIETLVSQICGEVLGYNKDFNFELSEDDKENMLKDFYSDLRKVLFEDDQVKKWLEDHKDTLDEKDKERIKQIKSLIKGEKKNIADEQSQGMKVKLEKLFADKLEYVNSSGNAFKTLDGAVSWFTNDFKNEIENTCESANEVKVVDRDMFNSFLKIVKGWRNKVKRFIQPENEKTTDEKIHEAIWNLWNDNLKYMLSEKISWEQWECFIDTFCTDGKCCLLNIADYEIVSGATRKFVDIIIRDKDSALNFVKRVFKLVIEKDVRVIDLSHVYNFTKGLLDCMKPKDTIDLATLFTAEDFYGVLKETNLFQYAVVKVRDFGDLPEEFEYCGQQIEELVDGICDDVLKDFKSNDKTKLKEQMFGDFNKEVTEKLKEKYEKKEREEEKKEEQDGNNNITKKDITKKAESEEKNGQKTIILNAATATNTINMNENKDENNNTNSKIALSNYSNEQSIINNNEFDGQNKNQEEHRIIVERDEIISSKNDESIKRMENDRNKPPAELNDENNNTNNKITHPGDANQQPIINDNITNTKDVKNLKQNKDNDNLNDQDKTKDTVDYKGVYDGIRASNYFCHNMCVLRDDKPETYKQVTKHFSIWERIKLVFYRLFVFHFTAKEARVFENYSYNDSEHVTKNISHKSDTSDIENKVKEAIAGAEKKHQNLNLSDSNKTNGTKVHEENRN